MHQVCAESYAVGCMDEWGMTVIIQTDSYSALTYPSMSSMTSLTKILLVYFVTNKLLFSHWTVFGNRNRASWLSYNRIWVLALFHCAFDPSTCTDELSCLPIWSLKSRSSWHRAKLVHKLLSLRYDVTNYNLPIYSSRHAGPFTMSSSTSDIYIGIS